MRKLMVLAFTAGTCLPLLGAGAAHAQQAPQDGSGPTTVASPEAGRRAPAIEKWSGFDLLTSAVADGAANDAGTGTRAYGAQLRLGLAAFRVLTVSTDLGIVGMSDEREFTQETTHGEKTSGVAAGVGTLALGLRMPPLAVGGNAPATVSAGVNAGYALLHVTRTITNCADCHGEDVPLRAGAFWETGLEVNPGRRWGISARYRTYQGRSDLRNALMIGGVVKIPSRSAEPETAGNRE
jgi:mono/diheme cytochrome c family protein